MLIEEQLKQFKKNPLEYIRNIPELFRSRIYPDRLYLKKLFKEKTGNVLSLENPVTFNEKIQWIKLYYRKPMMTQMADKYRVRKLVKEKIGEEYLIPLIDVFGHYSDISFDRLPNQFALKATHGSGWNFINSGEKDINWESIRYHLKRYYNNNYYYFSREWAYKNIEPMFICEKFIADESGNPPTDYKIFCFHGEPKIIQVDVERFTEHKRNFYDCDWGLLDFALAYPNFGHEINKPKNFQKMLTVSQKLSSDLIFARVDLYNIDGQIYFGEISFYPEAGYGEFSNKKWDKRLGDWIKLTA